jgi:hypothetical protein
LVEHATENRSVGGSIPPLGTINQQFSWNSPEGCGRLDSWLDNSGGVGKPRAAKKAAEAPRRLRDATDGEAGWHSREMSKKSMARLRVGNGTEQNQEFHRM